MGRNFARGTADQMLNAFRAKLADMEGTVESSEDIIKSCDDNGALFGCDLPECEDNIEVITSAEDTDDKDGSKIVEYLDELTSSLEAEVDEEVDSIECSHDDSVFYVVISADGEVTELRVPFKDLTFNINKINKDVRYIANAVREHLSAE